MHIKRTKATKMMTIIFKPHRDEQGCATKPSNAIAAYNGSDHEAVLKINFPDKSKVM